MEIIGHYKNIPFPEDRKDPSTISAKYRCNTCQGDGVIEIKYHCPSCCGVGVLGFFDKYRVQISSLPLKAGNVYTAKLAFFQKAEKLEIQEFRWDKNVVLEEGFVAIPEILMRVRLLNYNTSIWITMDMFLSADLKEDVQVLIKSQSSLING